MIRIVVGGQINKQEICAFTKDFCGSAATVDVKNDLDAAMAMQMGQYDYYIGACNTGGGGALALAMALSLCACAGLEDADNQEGATASTTSS